MQFSKERKTPGLDQVGSINFGPKNGPAPMEHINTIPKKLSCPFGMSDCRGCKIALNVDGKIECSVSILAKSSLREGFSILTKENK